MSIFLGHFFSFFCDRAVIKYLFSLKITVINEWEYKMKKKVLSSTQIKALFITVTLKVT